MRHSMECIAVIGADLGSNHLLDVAPGSRATIARQYHAADESRHLRLDQCDSPIPVGGLVRVAVKDWTRIGAGTYSRGAA
jgi:hypothetical protein